MARPQILQMLKHGKMLCGNVFKQFVETWNYIINRVENIKGDADTNPETGHIKIDNSDPEHPIVRLANLENLTSGGDGDDGDADVIGTTQRSIETIRLNDDDEFIETPYKQLFDFNEQGVDWSGQPNRALRFEDDEINSNPLVHSDVTSEIVIRQNFQDGQKEIDYVASEIFAPHERVDSDDNAQKSVEYRQSTVQGAPKELQLYNFDDDTTCTPTTMSSGEGFLIRRKQGNNSYLDYMDASALDNFVHGGGGACIEMQGTPTGNVPIDCQGKLVKFNTAADSNVEVDVQETVAGRVDVTIGVYYV